MNEQLRRNCIKVTYMDFNPLEEGKASSGVRRILLGRIREGCGLDVVGKRVVWIHECVWQSLNSTSTFMSEKTDKV